MKTHTNLRDCERCVAERGGCTCDPIEDGKVLREVSRYLRLKASTDPLAADLLTKVAARIEHDDPELIEGVPV